MSQDKFSYFGKDFPAIDWEDVTPNDSTALSRTPRAVYIGGAGNLSVISHEDNTSTFVGLTAGTVLKIQPNIIKATGTTATNIIALY